MVGRLLGMVLIGLALIMASADAVMALGPHDYAGIVTADVLTLLLGDPMAADGGGMLHRLEHLVLALPAWTVILLMGIGAMVAGRSRPRRYRFRRA